MSVTPVARGRHRRPALDALGDSELIVLVRGGERAASAELWRRHAAAARTVARAWSSSLDPDDLVSEAFLRVLSALERGSGPEGAFRPYLFTAVRNVAASWGRRQDRERPLEAVEDVVAPGPGPEESVLAAADRDLGVRAFRALPPRWQEVLWYTEVEGSPPRRSRRSSACGRTPWRRSATGRARACEARGSRSTSGTDPRARSAAGCSIEPGPTLAIASRRGTG
ncbi:RNA polymerase sigma factor, sigma-70 family [Rathayibacter oskolensis]|uniref:RNA polymerase sigma factor, sigma-70 family n=1 Tax=Rathayibacter oskolensis TaxID=1891671 RepID=A0A1X7N2L9_9MICO|nr:sigma-70 family RNA polymerase sigma factor [Rathayibacter oskolensis]SMH31567.1 RNA polymerase sigma factor, sigma-70 family [Rathayibacter oskolensis]